jgi:ferric-dicitrate binding protein FerR (iron transport regulator)
MIAILFFSSRALVFLLCLIVASVALPVTSLARQADDPVPFFIGKNILSLKKLLASHERNEAEARESLQGAKNILAIARRNNNAEAENIARQAIAVAEESLTEIRKMKERDKGRLEVLEDAVKRRAFSKDSGVPTIEKGEVIVTSGSGRRKQDHRALESGDTVETGKSGFMELLMPDHSKVAVAANTAVEILRLDAEKLESAYRFIRGKLYVVRACLKEAMDLRGICWVTHYRVGGGVAAVRGTEFTVERNEDGSTAIDVIEGTVDVSEGGSGRVVSAKTMERVLIGESGSVQGPIPLKPGAVGRWWESVR